MRTPSLRNRVRSSGALVLLVVLLAFDAAVFLSLRSGLEDSLLEVLGARADIAVALAEVTGSTAELARELTALGIPARVTAADGTEFEADPELPRFSQAGVPTATPFPRVQLHRDLPDGGSVAVFVTRAGVDATLARLVLSLLLATAAGLALALVLLGKATERALAPLRDVADVADRTSAGSADERLEPDRPRTELGRVAIAFDLMLDRLGTALDEAVASDERTQRFLADAAHQLRTPIAGIQASVESLLRQSDEGERDRLMGNIVRETGRGARLVNGLLRMAHLDRRQAPRTVPTDLEQLAADEVARAADLAPHLTVTLVDETDGPGAATLDVEAQQLREAVGNLLDNARRHARTAVVVTVRRDIDGVVLRVSDDGPGVPAELVDVVFDRFATLDGKGGSGLGLPIARGVARAHGGDLIYEAGDFVLRVPARPDGGRSGEATRDSTARTAATSPSETT